METNNIDEAEQLIKDYRLVMEAKKQITELMNDGYKNDDCFSGNPGDYFTLVDKGTQIEIPLHGLIGKVTEAIEDVLNGQYDMIVQKMRKL